MRWRSRAVLRHLLLAVMLVVAWPTMAQEKVRAGVLKFGTVSWELDALQHHGLDKANGFTLEVTGFGGNDGADVALMGGTVDVIVEDWLWANRARADGTKLAFVPYSSAVGSMMVKEASPIKSVADLAGKKIGVAGGPLDKSWLLLQALAKREAGLDLAKAAEPVYGAPPLLLEKARSGEIDAVLIYWQFAARLEADGFRSLIGVGQVMERLGVSASTPQLGWVFKEEWAAANPELVQKLITASRATKKIMVESDSEWQRLQALTKAETPAVQKALMTRWREGVPKSWGDAERAAAAKLYLVLAELGGEKLVGSAKELLPGTFWQAARW